MTRLPFAWFRLFSVLAIVSAASGSTAQQGGSTPPSLRSPGPYYALVIGNDNYQSLPRLQTASNDARGIARLLREEYGFSTTVLIDATRADILDALITYRRKLPANSNLLIYYAGHGSNDVEAKVAYWLPVDAQSTTNANWISADDITAELRVIKSIHVLVIADSCYSGALMRSATDGVDIISNVKPDERNYYIEKLLGVKSRNIMASGGTEPVSDGGVDGHSIFAAVLLQSLRDLDAPQFTAGSLFQRVVVRVAGRSQQTPQYSGIINSQHDGGDFVFIRQPGTVPPEDLCCSTLKTVAAKPRGETISKSTASSDADDIEQIVERYRNAYENEDVSELQLLWPTITSQDVRHLQDFFRTARSVKLHYSILGTPEIGSTSATISVSEDLNYVMDGRAMKVPAQKAKIRLSRHPEQQGDAGWKIVSIQ